MTVQQEIIEFCKANDPNYNKEASFKDLEPMWTIPKGIGGLGITESEFKNGFYIRINTKGRKGFEHLEGRVFYFIEKVEPSKYCSQIYNSHWKKYFVPLDALENWGKEIVSQIYDKSVTKEKVILHKIEDFAISSTPMVFYEDGVTVKPVEEFPIQKIHMQTMYKTKKSETNIIITKSSVEHRVMVSISDEENIEDIDDYYRFSFTKERFSDLVDLMIEARKDLLK